MVFFQRSVDSLPNFSLRGVTIFPHSTFFGPMVGGAVVWVFILPLGWSGGETNFWVSSVDLGIVTVRGGSGGKVGQNCC